MRRFYGLLCAVICLAASSCTFELRDPGVTVACTPLVFEINTHQAGIGAEQYDAIVDTFEEFGALVGRDVVFNGTTTTTYLTHTADDPVLVELTWPQDAPNHLGYAEAAIVGDEYVSGWIYFNPAIGQAPAGMVRRLVMHELGHLYGLLDVEAETELMNPALTVDNWGEGDLAGFTVTHDFGCSDARIVDTLINDAETGRVQNINHHNGNDYGIETETDWQTLINNHTTAHNSHNHDD